MLFTRQFAETAEANADLFSTLGVDWRLLILQVIAFLILVFLLGKFVYPWLMKSVDERQANIEEAAKAATEAKKAAADNKEQVAALLAEARKEAAEIVGTAKLESAEIVANSETKAKKSAEHIVSEAHEQVEKDIAAARKTLYNDTLDLVALATEKVVSKDLTAAIDQKEIARAVKESA